MGLSRDAGLQPRVRGRRARDIPYGADVSTEWDEIDEMFSVLGSDADLSGCPPASTVTKIAREPAALDDWVYAHLETCGACYLQVRKEAISLARDRRSKRSM
jgi:hypothetical protein